MAFLFKVVAYYTTLGFVPSRAVFSGKERPLGRNGAVKYLFSDSQPHSQRTEGRKLTIRKDGFFAIL